MWIETTLTSLQAELQQIQCRRREKELRLHDLAQEVEAEDKRIHPRYYVIIYPDSSQREKVSQARQAFKSIHKVCTGDFEPGIRLRQLRSEQQALCRDTSEIDEAIGRLGEYLVTLEVIFEHLRAALRSIYWFDLRCGNTRKKRAVHELGGQHSADQSRLFALKELLRGDVGSPRILNLELGSGSLCESKPRNIASLLC